MRTILLLVAVVATIAAAADATSTKRFVSKRYQYSLVLVAGWTSSPRFPERVAAKLAPRAVLFSHWDDFFRPLSKPLRALPYAGDDLDASIAVLDVATSQEDGGEMAWNQMRSGSRPESARSAKRRASFGTAS